MSKKKERFPDILLMAASIKGRLTLLLIFLVSPLIWLTPHPQIIGFDWVGTSAHRKNYGEITPHDYLNCLIRGIFSVILLHEFNMLNFSRGSKTDLPLLFPLPRSVYSVSP